MRRVFLVLFLIFAGCTTGNVVKDVNESLPNCTEIVCNPPYMRFESSCCLDTNFNNICDEDEVKTDVLTDEERLEETAKQFAEYRENHNYDLIYNLLVHDKKDLIDKSDFIALFEGVEFGYDNVILGDEVERRVAEDNIDKINFKELNDNGSVVFDIETNLGFDDEENYVFVLENNEWKLDAYDLIVYRSCYAEVECKVFSSECNSTCEDKHSKFENEFLCRDNLCHCKCTNNNNIGRFFVPDFE